MSRAVVVCPGRGSYTRAELGSLARLHPDKTELFAGFDRQRIAAGQVTLADLDGAARYSVAHHTRGDNASALIYAASLADFRSIDRDRIDIVAVTGNSMGWYSTLACAGALSADAGFGLANTMGQLMQDRLIGGQLVYPVCGDDWRPDAARRGAVLDLVARIDARADCDLALSIDLGGLLVLAGNRQGLDAFAARAAPIGRYPLRLANHAAFHTRLQLPVSQIAQTRFGATFFAQPALPMIDGRGAIWWPRASDTEALFAYTLGHQIVAPYDFRRAIMVAAREFAPDLFIVLGPGTAMGGAVAQSLIACAWQGMACKADFQALQAQGPFLVSMGCGDQCGLATG